MHTYFKYSLVFFVLFLTACKTHYVKQKENFSHVELKSQIENVKAKHLTLPYKLKIDSFVERVVAISSEELTRDGAQTNLGNFMCDAVKHVCKQQLTSDTINFYFFNRGGLRTNLPKGEIKVKNIYEVMPFENEMVLLTLKGEDIIKGIPTILSKNHPFLGLKIIVKNKKPTAFLSNNDSIISTKLYHIITSDFIANGGDNFDFLMIPIQRKNIPLKIRDAMIEYGDYLTKSGKQINPYKDDRLQFSE